MSGTITALYDNFGSMVTAWNSMENRATAWQEDIMHHEDPDNLPGKNHDARQAASLSRDPIGCEPPPHDCIDQPLATYFRHMTASYLGGTLCQPL